MHNQPVVSRMVLHWNLSRTGKELSQNRFFDWEKPVVPFFVKVKMSSNSDQTVAAALIPLASAWLETFCIKYLASSVVFRGGWQVACFLAVAITGETGDWRTGKKNIYIIAVSRLLCNTNKQVSSLPPYYIFLLCWTDAKGRKTHRFIWIWSCFLLGGRYGKGHQQRAATNSPPLPHVRLKSSQSKNILNEMQFVPHFYSAVMEHNALFLMETE